MSSEKENYQPSTKTSEEKIAEMYAGNYLERSGINSRQAVEALMSPPESPLSNEDKDRAYRFEQQILDTETEKAETVGLILAPSTPSLSPSFFA